MHQEWANLLEWLSEGRWRRSGLQAAELLPTPSELPRSERPPDDPLLRAWLMANAFADTTHRAIGRFCTPREVALQLAEDTLGKPSNHVVDPACGAGALLLAAAEISRSRGSQIDLDRVVGADVDPVAAALAQAVVWLAAGAPARPVGRFLVRDFLLSGCRDLLEGRECVVLANPPWGVKPSAVAVDAWIQRVGPECARLVRGERNIYVMFLVELLLRETCAAGFVTPIHWLHLRSLVELRRALAQTGRLSRVFVLRKQVFSAAPDMIPALTAWTRDSTNRPTWVRRTGFAGGGALGSPLPAESEVSISVDEWRESPFCILPMLRSSVLSEAGRCFARFPVRFGDTARPRRERLFHFGDGIYKSRLKNLTSAARAGWPVLTQAAKTGRYRLDPASLWLNAPGMDVLSDADRRRFSRPMLLLHALKKANAPWRLGTALVSSEVPLAVTNNFLVATPVQYDGDLHYPLALLNSRLFNRVYTEHFPGVNIEAYTVGSLPLPWPVRPGASTYQGAPATARQCVEWARGAIDAAGTIREDVYQWLCDQGSQLVRSGGLSSHGDHCIEAVLVGAFGWDEAVLDTLLCS